MSDRLELDTTRKSIIAAWLDVAKEVAPVFVWAALTVSVMVGFARAMQLVKRTPEPLTGVAYTRPPQSLSKSTLTVLLLTETDVAEVDEAIDTVAKTGDYRWLYSLEKRKSISILPEHSALAIVEAPMKLQLFFSDSLYKVRVIDGETAGQVGYIPHSSLSSEATAPQQTQDTTAVPNRTPHPTAMEASGITATSSEPPRRNMSNEELRAREERLRREVREMLKAK